MWLPLTIKIINTPLCFSTKSFQSKAGRHSPNDLPPEISYNPFTRGINRYSIAPDHIDDFVLMLRNFTFRAISIESGEIVFMHNFGDVPESNLTKNLIDLSLVKYYTLEAQGTDFSPFRSLTQESISRCSKLKTREKYLK